MATSDETAWSRIEAKLGRDPRVVRDCGLIEASTLMAAVAEACKRTCGEGKRTKFYVGGCLTDPRGSVPLEADLSPETWIARACGGSNASVLLYTSDVSEDLRARVLERLRDRLGDELPRRGADVTMDVFLGRYPFTAGGIHRESGSNLHCVVSGDKRMLLWPKSHWDPPPSDSHVQIDPVSGEEEVFLTSVDPATAEADAIVLHSCGDDMFYWTAGWRHIGTSPAPSLSFSLTFNVVA